MIYSPISGLVHIKNSDRHNRVHLLITPMTGVAIEIFYVKKTELEPEIVDGAWVEVGDILCFEGCLAYQLKDYN